MTTRCSRSCCLRCVVCRQTYVIPTSAPQRTRYEAERAAQWLAEHPCEAKALPL